MTTRGYLLDSNVFIEAHRRYYAFHLCPGFWKSLIWLHVRSSVISLDKVKDEMVTEADALAAWSREVMPESAFAVSENEDVLQVYSELQVWAQSQGQFTSAALEEFATVADAWLIAYAKVHDLKLVTHEVYDGNIKRRIPIPNVCRDFGVITMDSFEMLSELSISFDWSPPE